MTFDSRVLRVTSSVFLAIAFASIIVNLTSSKNQTDITITALLSMLFVISRNLIRGIYLFSISFAITSLIVSSASLHGIFIGKSSYIFLIMVAIVWISLIVVGDLLVGRSSKFMHKPVLDFYIILFALPLSAYWSSGDEVSALQYLASSGEDNGAWLQGLSARISDGDQIYNASSSFGGGTTLSSFHTMTQSIFTGINQSQITNLDNVLILQREYGLLALLIVSCAFGVSYVKLNFVNEISRVLSAGVIALMSYASVSAVMASGHLSALVTIWLLFALFSAVTDSMNSHSRIYLAFLTLCGICLLLAAARSWYPLMPVSAIAITGLLAKISHNLYLDATTKRLTGRNVKIILLTISAILLSGIAFFSYKVLQPYVISSWGELLKNIGYSGGSNSASALVLGIVIIIVAINAIDPSVRNFKITNIEILFLTLSLLYLLAVTLLSQVAPPNRNIMYSATKLQLVFVAIALPYAVVWVYRKLNNPETKFSLVFISGALLTFFVFEVSLGQFVNFPLKINRENVVWAAGVVNALKSDESARVVCINPNSDGQDYAAYVCSRMSSGITGGFGAPDSVWQAKQLGLVSNERFRDEIPQSFYDDLTIVSFDPGRRSSEDPARQDWMQYIPWQRVNVVGIK